MPIVGPSGPGTNDSSVQVAPDSTGKLIDNTSVTTQAGAVQRQRVSIADAIMTNNAVVTAAGALQVDGSLVTQPISAAAPLAVTGTFYQTTQPVSFSNPYPAARSATLDDVLLEMRAIRMGIETLLDQYGAGLKLLEVADAG